jgi:UDP-N-acetylglucosamine 4,6-dehydratase/5-epimerase
VNLYGATKLCAEKIITQGNAYAADSPARFSSVRYGNVVGSRGSVLPLFKRQAEEGELTITDEAMTRFWITLDRAVGFVLDCLERMQGGEVFIPKIPSMRVVDLAEAIAPEASRRVIGIRPGEKVHEVLITPDESRHAFQFDGYFAVYPSFAFWRDEEFPRGDELPPGFRYASDNNEEWLALDDIRELAQVRT